MECRKSKIDFGFLIGVQGERMGFRLWLWGQWPGCGGYTVCICLVNSEPVRSECQQILFAVECLDGLRWSIVHF